MFNLFLDPNLLAFIFWYSKKSVECEGINVFPIKNLKGILIIIRYFNMNKDKFNLKSFKISKLLNIKFHKHVHFKKNQKCLFNQLI